MRELALPRLALGALIAQRMTLPGGEEREGITVMPGTVRPFAISCQLLRAKICGWSQTVARRKAFAGVSSGR